MTQQQRNKLGEARRSMKSAIGHISDIATLPTSQERILVEAEQYIHAALGMLELLTAKR